MIDEVNNEQNSNSHANELYIKEILYPIDNNIFIVMSINSKFEIIDSKITINKLNGNKAEFNTGNMDIQSIGNVNYINIGTSGIVPVFLVNSKNQILKTLNENLEYGEYYGVVITNISDLTKLTSGNYSKGYSLSTEYNAINEYELEYDNYIMKIKDKYNIYYDWARIIFYDENYNITSDINAVKNENFEEKKKEIKDKIKNGEMTITKQGWGHYESDGYVIKENNKEVGLIILAPFYNNCCLANFNKHYKLTFVYAGKKDEDYLYNMFNSDGFDDTVVECNNKRIRYEMGTDVGVKIVEEDTENVLYYNSEYKLVDILDNMREGYDENFELLELNFKTNMTLTFVENPANSTKLTIKD